MPPFARFLETSVHARPIAAFGCANGPERADAVIHVELVADRPIDHRRVRERVRRAHQRRRSRRCDRQDHRKIFRLASCHHRVDRHLPHRVFPRRISAAGHPAAYFFRLAARPLQHFLHFFFRRNDDGKKIGHAVIVIKLLQVLRGIRSVLFRPNGNPHQAALLLLRAERLRQVIHDLFHHRLAAYRVVPFDVRAKLLGRLAGHGMRRKGDSQMRHAALRHVQNREFLERSRHHRSGRNSHLLNCYAVTHGRWRARASMPDGHDGRVTFFLDLFP